MLIPRHQLAVASPLNAKAVLRGAIAGTANLRGAHGRIAHAVAKRYDARNVALTDSGTSALVDALRIAVGPGGVVAYPAYCCVDIIAAAHRAGIRIRLYDLDPHTLSPDLDSLHAVLQEGVDAVLVAHLYGFPADIQAVRSVANTFSSTRDSRIVIIEDSAQGIGATLHGKRAGSLGDLSILSFGRGKGVTGGAGGAVLALDPQFEHAITQRAAQLGAPSRGLVDWAKAASVWALGRPQLYAIPSAIPGLHLGETVYHEAHEPRPMSLAAAATLEGPFHQIDRATNRRRNVASAYQECIDGSKAIRGCKKVPGGKPGFLRFPILPRAQSTTRHRPMPEHGFPKHGVMRGYPRPLSEEPETQPILAGSPAACPGARELAQHLLTLPTHHLVSSRDVRQLCNWLHTL